MGKIILKGVSVHNLNKVDLELPDKKLIVFTGVSGSGKSSLAFDTLFAEGQRRYIESLSVHLRRTLGEMPQVEHERIEGISPTIAIEQKSVNKNRRSNVGTLTQGYDFLRILFARLGTPHCPISGEALSALTPKAIYNSLRQLPKGAEFTLLSPYASKKGRCKEEIAELKAQGFIRARIDGKICRIDEPLSLHPSRVHDIQVVIDRLSNSDLEQNRIKEGIHQALEVGKGSFIASIAGEGDKFFSQTGYCPKSGLSYPLLQPYHFSFNHPQGMCPTCEGLGSVLDFNLHAIIDPDKSIKEGCCFIAGSINTVKWSAIYKALAKECRFSLTTPWKRLSKTAQTVFLYGTPASFPLYFRHPQTKRYQYYNWVGVINEAKLRLGEAKSDLYKQRMESLMVEVPCSDCKQSRLAPYPSATLFGGKTIKEITQLTIGEAHHFFSTLKLEEQAMQIGSGLIKEITKRLQFLQDVGLYYLSLDRSSATLSGGEAQRVRLASQIGSGLVGMTYILDEPSIGLHQQDNQKLIQTLKALRDLGNTVIVVEHDEETIASADYVVDMGPGAGTDGGTVVGKGTLDDILQSQKSLTGQYLSGKKSVAPLKNRRKIQKERLVHIYGATHHNLKNIDITIPLGLFTAITGSSGSGKSSLIIDILYPALANRLHGSHLSVGKCRAIDCEKVNKIIAIDQTPIGRTPRSNPSTYIKLFDDIRTLFASLPQSQALGFAVGRFSFNILEGSCLHCRGRGSLTVNMDFLEDMQIQCPLCLGKRFDERTLSIHYKGKNIDDVLKMTVRQALNVFTSFPHIYRKLLLLEEVGLGYLTLGQSSTTLSGGEAQRIKLAKELIRPPKKETLYILDEPTTGLHFEDVKKLLSILHRFVDQGSTVVVIEHNLDLIKTADHIIDLGPEGGARGGEIVGEGPPETIARKKTPTGIALKKAFSSRCVHPVAAPSNAAPLTHISVVNARHNNLKGINALIPHHQITVCTGVSGSGKSSFAFDTLYAEGQRRYVESLSTYSRQFIKQMPPAQVDHITGLSPAISIEQKRHTSSPRSTVGTLTEVYDYLRLLYAHIGTPFCPETNEKIESITKERALDYLKSHLENNAKLHILAQIPLKNIPFQQVKEELLRSGFLRIRLNNTYYEIDQAIPFDPAMDNQLFLVLDRLVFKPSNDKRCLDAMEQASIKGGQQFTVDADGKDIFFNLAFAVPRTGKTYPNITPHTFSFNTEEGMCPDCQGLGFQWGANLLQHGTDKLSAIELIEKLQKNTFHRESHFFFTALMQSYAIDIYTKIKHLPPDKRAILFDGAKEKVKVLGHTLEWKGINAAFNTAAKLGKGELRQGVLRVMDQHLCPTCQGDRLHPLATHVLVNGVSLPKLCRMSIKEALSFIENLQIPENKQKLLQETLEQTLSRLRFLVEIGVDYLSLSRSAPTLSGGETQRIYLAKQLGSSLTGCLYILDEPTIGLHPHNNQRLNQALLKLKNRKNTLILVEHDPLTLSIGDYFLDFGPRAGRLGGNIIAEGTLEEIKNNKDSLTGAYLAKRKSLPPSKQRAIGKEAIVIENACKHNLKNITVTIPLGTFTTVAGVSGSGKSTLIRDILCSSMEKHLSSPMQKSVTLEGATVKGLTPLKRLIVLDQNPIGRTTRADVATYTDILTPLRAFFASLPQAQIRGLSPGMFSYYTKQGMCKKCFGLGSRSIHLQYLPSVHITCEDCQGHRLNEQSLSIRYKGKHLGDLLSLTVKEAQTFLPAIPKVHTLLNLITEVGLDYLCLNQPIHTLSGGEGQRLRLISELKKTSSKTTLYVFDEPTVGLHFDDIAKIIPIFQKLVDKGNTLVVIEHNLDIIRQSDFVLELGPQGGDEGGKLLASGPLALFAKNKASITANYL